MGDAAEQEPFEQIAERLLKELIEEGCEDEAPESITTAYLDYVIKRERIRRDATDAGQRQDAVDYETLLAFRNADSDNPQHAHAMLTFQRLGVDPIKAVEYVERLITSRQTELSQKMTDIASKQRPRGRKPFRKIIDEIVRQNPNISRNSLLQRLKTHEDLSIKNDEIVYNPTRDVMTIDALRGALSRSKKRVSKNLKKHSR
jgi:hypothetical protein